MERTRALAVVAGWGLLLPSAGWCVIDGQVRDWVGESTMLGGTAQVSTGEYVYQDHVWDDYGADTGQRPPNYSNLSSSSAVGDFRYPTDEERYGHNVADLFQVRFAADTDTVWFLAWMNTLKAVDTTVVAIAIDVDPAAATGAGVWPYAAGVATPGADYVVTLRDGAGDVVELATGVVTPLASVAFDVAANTIEAVIPRALVPGDAWRVRVASGLWDVAAEEWMVVPAAASTESEPGYGSPAVSSRLFNAAFRWNDEGAYMEGRQAAALAAGDLSAFYADLDLALLAGGGDVPYAIESGRFYSAIFESDFTIPPFHEGTSFDGVPGRFPGLGGAALSQAFSFYGRFQPYGIYLPSTWDSGSTLPVALVLHGVGGSHSGYNRFPGFLEDFGENPPTILVTPLGRGASFYADYGEADVFEALEDVRARFGFDAERLYLTGYSMGGYGVYRLGSLYPDLFAAAVAWAGYTGQYLGTYLTSYRDLIGQEPPVGGGGAPSGQGKASIGDPVDTLENFIHLPLLHLAPSNDEIVPTTGQYAAARKLQRLRYRYRFDLYPGYEHLSFGLVDDWKVARDWLGDRHRATRPRRVVYRSSDAWTDASLAGPLGIDPGSAWWMQDLAMREHQDSVLHFATVDAVSHAVPGDRTSARDTVGVGIEPTPNLQLGTEWDAVDPEPLANRLELGLENAASVRVVLAEASLAPAALEVSLVTDGPVTVTLEGDFTGLSVTAPAGVSIVQADAAALVLAATEAGAYAVTTGTP